MQLAGLQSNKAGINFDRNVAEVDLGDRGIDVFPKCLGRVMCWMVPGSTGTVIKLGGVFGQDFFLRHFNDSLFT